MKRTTNQPAVAYSYVRFSSPEQAKGDSLRRQTELRDQWCEGHGITLDTSLTLRDEGISAFTGGHRENPDRHALAAFLTLVRDGRIPRGSYLIVESLDRLSREHIRPALTLLLNLIEAGIRVVQLLPTEQVFDEKVEPMTLMMAIMELSRGHSESRMKSERVGQAWAAKKKRAVESGVPLTKTTPAWLKLRGGKFVVIDSAAEAVRLIYRLAAEGQSLASIVTHLNKNRVPTIGSGEFWAPSYVGKILSTRTVVGEFQPMRWVNNKPRPEGDPVQGYFPAVITEDLWHTVRGGMTKRKRIPGRGEKLTVNIFAGLLTDAGSNGPIHIVKKARGVQFLTPYLARIGVSGSAVSFPFAVFEKAILGQLREIDPRDVLPTGNGTADSLLALSGRVSDLDDRIEKIKAELIRGGDITSLADVLRTLEVERKTVADELAAERARQATPLEQAWGEVGSLTAALAAAGELDAARARLRAAVRRVVSKIYCLFVAKKRRRLAAVQIWFDGGAHRDYLILYTPGAGGGRSPVRRESRWSVTSFSSPGRAGELDFRRPADVKELEAALAAIDPATLG